MSYSVIFNLTDRVTMTAVFPSRKQAIREVKAFVSDTFEDSSVTVTEPFDDDTSLIVRDMNDGETMRIVGTIVPTAASAHWVMHEQ